MRVVTDRQRSRRRVIGRLGAAIGLILGGLTAGGLVAAGNELPDGSLAALAVATLGLAIGAVLVSGARHRSASPGWRDNELVRLLGSTLDDRWVLLCRPNVAGAGAELDGLLIGPPGVRALVVRTWDGRYRLHGRRWEYDAGGRNGWIRCRTDPGQQALQLRDAVKRWATETVGPHVPVEAAVAFPRRATRVVLEAPEVEVVTTDNAPWWAQRIGRVQRLNAAQVEAVVRAAVTGPPSARSAPNAA
jgi:hypothetical protein